MKKWILILVAVILVLAFAVLLHVTGLFRLLPPEAGEEITVNAQPVETVIKDGKVYCAADKLADALGMEYTSRLIHDEMSGRYQFRFMAFRRKTTVDGETFGLTARPFRWMSSIYLPVEDAARALHCSVYTDPETSQLYLTPGAGDWTLPQDKKIPILMYHAVSDNLWGIPELFASPSEVEKQLAYLVDNGYDPIWFEDLPDIDQYDKPVIITLDDGYDDNYAELYPLLQKYNVKATIFVIGNGTPESHKMTHAQIRELSDSGLVSIQSHTMSHNDLAAMSEEELHYEFGQSKQMITRITGKEPFVVCYPTGSYTDNMLEIAREYYRFGTRTNETTADTSGHPLLLGRYTISRETTIEDFAAILSEAESN